MKLKQLLRRLFSPPVARVQVEFTSVGYHEAKAMFGRMGDYHDMIAPSLLSDAHADEEGEEWKSN